MSSHAGHQTRHKVSLTLTLMNLLFQWVPGEIVGDLWQVSSPLWALILLTCRMWERVTQQNDSILLIMGVCEGVIRRRPLYFTPMSSCGHQSLLPYWLWLQRSRTNKSIAQEKNPSCCFPLDSYKFIKAKSSKPEYLPIVLQWDCTKHPHWADNQ